jgi:predicted regulator of Ras-like GTPase activity (Roadblock/LC7/MglB family)
VRRADLPEIVAALEAPIDEFVREAQLRMALLVRGSGQVVGQHGFTRSYEVMNVATLAAAAHASSRALAQLVGASGWTHLYHAGQDGSLFLAPVATPVEELILIAIFDNAASLGMVQFFFQRLSQQIAVLSIFETERPGTDHANFEKDLQAGVQRVLFPDAEAED